MERDRQLQQIQMLYGSGAIAPAEAHFRRAQVLSQRDGTNLSLVAVPRAPRHVWQSQVASSLAVAEAAPFAVPLSLDLARPARQSRLLLFAKAWCVLPLQIWLTAYSSLALVVSLLAFVAILFTGRYPLGFYRFVQGFIQAQCRVLAYHPLLLTDRWSQTEDHPLRIEAEPPQGLSRLLLILIKLPARVFMAPALLTFLVLACLTLLAAPISLIILITGRYPRPLFGLVRGSLQWYARVTAWQFWMSDDWRMLGESVPTRLATIIGGVALSAVVLYVGHFGGARVVYERLVIRPQVEHATSAFDQFMQTARRSPADTQPALNHVYSLPLVQQEFAGLLADREYFASYAGLTRSAWKATRLEDGIWSVEMAGELKYRRGPPRAFHAVMIEEHGAWKLAGLEIGNPEATAR